MSLAAIGVDGAPSGPKLCPVVIHRPMSASSARYSGPGAAACPTLPSATLLPSASMPCSFPWLGLSFSFMHRRSTERPLRHLIYATDRRRAESRCRLAEAACLGWADVSCVDQPAYGVGNGFLQPARLEAKPAAGGRVVARAAQFMTHRIPVSQHVGRQRRAFAEMRIVRA